MALLPFSLEVDFQKGCYFDIASTEHLWRIKRLIDIADIYTENGIFPMIIEECFSVYWLSHSNSYDVNIVNQETMMQYLLVTTRLLEQRKTKDRYMPEHLKIAAYYCVLEDYENATKYFEMFDATRLHRFNSWFKNYYLYARDVLKKHCK